MDTMPKISNSDMHPHTASCFLYLVRLQQRLQLHAARQVDMRSNFVAQHLHTISILYLVRNWCTPNASCFDRICHLNMDSPTVFA